MRTSSLRAALLALALVTAGCVTSPPPVQQASTADRSSSAVLNAMADQGVTVTGTDPATGAIIGQRGGITVIASIAPQPDGTTRVEFRTRGDIAQDPTLIDRLTRSYNARMGR
jgi:starvation-inducible outer membrane lipoprotein